MCSNYTFPGKCVPMIEKPSAKKILADSMLELSRTVTINKITVDMIVKNCGYSSKTFYNHFLDKYDLAYWIFETNSNRIIAQYSENCTWERYWAKSIALCTKTEIFSGYHGIPRI